jgi:hypothetical protein
MEMKNTNAAIQAYRQALGKIFIKSFKMPMWMTFLWYRYGLNQPVMSNECKVSCSRKLWLAPDWVWAHVASNH